MRIQLLFSTFCYNRIESRTVEIQLFHDIAELSFKTMGLVGNGHKKDDARFLQEVRLVSGDPKAGAYLVRRRDKMGYGDLRSWTDVCNVSRGYVCPGRNSLLSFKL